MKPMQSTCMSTSLMFRGVTIQSFRLINTCGIHNTKFYIMIPKLLASRKNSSNAYSRNHSYNTSNHCISQINCDIQNIWVQSYESLHNGFLKVLNGTGKPRVHPPKVDDSRPKPVEYSPSNQCIYKNILL